MKYFIYFFSLVYLSCSDEKILLRFSAYYPAIFMEKCSFMFYLFHSQSDEDADGGDGAEIPSVVLPPPATPAPLVTSAASVAPPAAPLVQEVEEILSGQYSLILLLNSNTIQLVVFVCLYCH